MRQVHAIALLLAFPYYAEQAGQLVRGFTEITRVMLWLDVPDKREERLERAITFWKDGIEQTRDKYRHQVKIGREVGEDRWIQLKKQDELIAAQEEVLGKKLDGMPSAKAMWKELGRDDLYGLFRWESDPAHGSAITLGTMVASKTDGHFELGGPNRPSDRARRLGASIMLLELSGGVLASSLGWDTKEWEKAVAETGDAMADLLDPILTNGSANSE